MHIISHWFFLDYYIDLNQNFTIMYVFKSIVKVFKNFIIFILITLKIKMFKSNLSPLNSAKEKFGNKNCIPNNYPILEQQNPKQ